MKLVDSSVDRARPTVPRAQAGHAAPWALSFVPWVLLFCTAAFAALRIGLILRFGEPDGDAWGHFGIAQALLREPFRLDLHWVWLPGFHYLLCGLIRLGATLNDVRLLNAGLSALLPSLVYAYTRAHLGSRASRSGPLFALWPRQARGNGFEPPAQAEREPGTAAQRGALWAALFCAAAPLVNMLGISAQQETLFTLLILLSMWTIDARRPVWAGVCLGLASLIRYEAWGAVALLTIAWILTQPLPQGRASPRGPSSRLSLSTIALPLFAIGGFVAIHRYVDGTWLGFLRELHRFTSVQRQAFFRSAWMEVFWFPAILPLFAFGPALLFLPFGIRRAQTEGFLVPLGIFAFLFFSYMTKGSLGSARYYESLTPAICILASLGLHARGTRWPRAYPFVAVAIFASLVVQTLAFIGWMCRG